MVLEKILLVHAGIMGIIGFTLLAIGSLLGIRWNRQKQLIKKNRRIHGYFIMASYIIAVVHIGQGLAAYVDLQGRILGAASALHWIHIVLAVGFLIFFTKVLIDGYRGIMRCRDGYIVLLWDAFLIVTGYVIRNLAFGEIIFPFL
jgi:hypothetical protein